MICDWEKEAYNHLISNDYVLFSDWGLDENLAKNYETYYCQGEIYVVRNKTTGRRCIVQARSPQEAVENVLGMRDYPLISHCEKSILKGCIDLMQELYTSMLDSLEWRGVDMESLEDIPKYSYTYNEIVRKLFLQGTSHSGGTSTRLKCEELGVDDCVLELEPNQDNEPFG